MFSLFSIFCGCGNDGVVFSSDGKTILSTPSKLENFEVPKEVETINGGDSALQSSFFKCSKTIKTITFEAGSSLVKIFPFVFSDSTLNSIDMSPCTQLKILSKGLFYRCKNLQTVILPEGLEKISLRSLQALDSIQKITIPASVKTIEGNANGEGALSSPIKEIKILTNSKLTSIGQSVFSGAKITSFYIPKDLKSIRGGFQGTKITNFEIHPENKNFNFKDGFLLSGDNKTIWYIINTQSDVVVPSYVTTLEYYAGNSNGMKSITFEGPIESWNVGHTFSYTNLVNITFPEGLKEVPWAAFIYCKKLESVTFSKDIVKICGSAFYGCSKLSKININDNITAIEGQAFGQCTSLKEFKCPKNLTEFGEGVFTQCVDLKFDPNGNTKFSIHDNILYVDGKLAREYFGDGGHVIVREFCQRISDSIFREKKITSIDIKSNISLEIGNNAFSKTNLQRIELPQCLKSIGEFSFQDSALLEEVIFNKKCTLTDIPIKCFYDCKKLHTVVFPSSITTIGENAFTYSTLTTQNLAETDLISIGKKAFAFTTLDTITLPTTLQKIEEEAFLQSKVKNIVLEINSMNLLMSSVFKNCDFLNSFTFSDTIENISSFAFSKCVSLESIVLPKSINVISENAFEYCSLLKTVSIPLDSKLEIKGQAFFNCHNLVEFVVAEGDTKFSFENGVLMNKERTKIVLFLPSSKKTIYVVPANVEKIGNYAFQDCKNLRTVIIPEGNITSVGFQAFDGCASLSSLYMSFTLTNFGKFAFDRCPKLNQCGSVVYETNDKTNAIKAGIPEIAFETNCPNTEKTCLCKYGHFSFTTFFLITMIL